MRRGFLIVALGFIGIGIGSCSLVVDPDVDSIGAPPRTCMPDEIGNCACLGGLTGTQRCNDGGYFDPCQCGAAGAGG